MLIFMKYYITIISAPADRNHCPKNNNVRSSISISAGVAQYFVTHFVKWREPQVTQVCRNTLIGLNNIFRKKLRSGNVQAS